ncbi:enoyl-CoA hydratase/isomerase [Apiospora arundinis]
MQLITKISTDDVKVSANDQGVAVLQLDRPAKRNAFSQAMIDTIVVALRELDNMPEVRTVVIAGLPEGPFCAGMDIKELVAITTAAAHQRKFLKDLTDAFASFSKPTIAAVVGAALGGGCEISLACDMIYAAEDAMFGLPEMKIGTIPGAGGTQRLARALGKHKAMEFILTGEPASGAEFERLGMVTRVFPQGESPGRGDEVGHQDCILVRPGGTNSQAGRTDSGVVDAGDGHDSRESAVLRHL